MRLCLTDQVAGWGLLVSTESNLWSSNYVPAWFSCNIRAQPLRRDSLSSVMLGVKILKTKM